jgi:cytochrome c oxidase accessory protein FixG
MSKFDPSLQINNAPPSTISKEGGRLKIYAVQPKKGSILKWRTRFAILLLIVYFGVPWIVFDGMPAFKLDAIDRKMILFGHYYFPTEIPFFIPFIFGTILTVFVLTSVLGRLFCGWVCPQTVFLQFIFAPIEKWIEGPAHIRRARDQKGWSVNGRFHLDRFWRLIAKHLVFALFAFAVANTFLAYFWGVKEVIHAMTHSPSENQFAFSVMLFVNGLFYFIYAHFKEQACVIMCPYARFQSVLADSKTMQISYDYNRGEGEAGRAKPALRKSVPSESYGDCVDCEQCVRVCPTGIDIRKGVQLECIGCARCADACDDIMKVWKKPKGLVRYASYEQLENPSGGVKILKPRFFVYVTLILISYSVYTYLLATRSLITADFLRQGGAPYLTEANGTILNPYILKLRNKDVIAHDYNLAFENPQVKHQYGIQKIHVEPAQLVSIPVVFEAPPHAFSHGSLETHVLLKDGEVELKKKISLVGPYSIR